MSQSLWKLFFRSLQKMYAHFLTITVDALSIDVIFDHLQQSRMWLSRITYMLSVFKCEIAAVYTHDLDRLSEQSYGLTQCQSFPWTDAIRL